MWSSICLVGAGVNSPNTARAPRGPRRPWVATALGALGLLRCLRHEGAEQGPQSFAAALRALDLSLFVLADRQGERHFAVALVAVVLRTRAWLTSRVIQL